MHTNSPCNIACSLKPNAKETSLVPVYLIGNHKSFLITPGSRTVLANTVAYKNLPAVTAPLATNVDISFEHVRKSIRRLQIKTLYVGWKTSHYDEVYKFDVDLKPLRLDPYITKSYPSCALLLNQETATLDGASYNTLHPDRLITKGNFAINADLLLTCSPSGIINLIGAMDQDALHWFPGMEVLGFDLDIEYKSNKVLTSLDKIKQAFTNNLPTNVILI